MSERQKASVSPSVVSFLGSFNSLPWSKPRLQNSVQVPPMYFRTQFPEPSWPGLTDPRVCFHRKLKAERNPMYLTETWAS